MRMLDQLVGVPLCWLLSKATRRKAQAKPALTPNTRPRLLVIHLSEMGAMVTARPAIAWLQSQLPQAEIFYLVFPLVAELVLTLGISDPAHVVVIDPHSAYTLASSGLSAIKKLRSKDLSAVLDFEGFSRISAVLARLTCPHGKRIGWHPYGIPSLYRGTMLTDKLVYSGHWPAYQQYFILAQAALSRQRNTPGLKQPPFRLAGLPCQQPSNYPGCIILDQPGTAVNQTQPTYKPVSSVAAEIRLTLHELGVDSQKRLVLLNPNCSDMLPQRRWPVERYAQLCLLLQAHFRDLAILVTGTKAERPAAEELVSSARHLVQAKQNSQISAVSMPIHSIAGTSLTELLALYSLSSLLITNDSGPAHLATLVNLSTVVMFGPETPALFAPLGPHTSLWAGLACSPCISPLNGKKCMCTAPHCMASITPEMVLKAAQTYLG